MDLLDNPFWVLGATPQTNKLHIVELAKKHSLSRDERAISVARSTLTNPRKRLAAELAGLPGLDPVPTLGVVALISLDPLSAVKEERLLSLAELPLARANLISFWLKSPASSTYDRFVSWGIHRLARAFNEIDSTEVLLTINEDRRIAGFPTIGDPHVVESEIENRRQYYRSVIWNSLNHLDQRKRIDMITKIVESLTAMGNTPAPILIDDLVDTYEVEVQNYLDEEEEKIDELLQRILTAEDTNASSRILDLTVDHLISAVKNWDITAQPIQVSAKSRGMSHSASVRVALKVRNISIHLFNERRKLDLSKKITAMLQEVIAEVPDVADRTEEDAAALREIEEQYRVLAKTIAEQRQHERQQAEAKQVQWVIVWIVLAIMAVLAVVLDW